MGDMYVELLHTMSSIAGACRWETATRGEQG